MTLNHFTNYLKVLPIELVYIIRDYTIGYKTKEHKHLIYEVWKGDPIYKNGPFRVWGSNGNLKYICNYKNGKKDGLVKEWSEFGRLISEAIFENGINKFERVFHPNGQLIYECQYKNGRKNGISKGWYTNGQLKYYYHYKNELKHGICKSWDRNGNLLHENRYKNGKKIHHKNNCDIM